MSNPDIPAALVVLQGHLVAAGAALTDPLTDVDRGVVANRGRQLRYYWGGEVDPPHMGSTRTLNSQLIGQRFIIAAAWPLSDLSEGLVTAIDIEMQALASEVRTRIDGDSQLGGNITDLELGLGQPDMITIANARHVVLHWDLDLAYTEPSINA